MAQRPSCMTMCLADTRRFEARFWERRGSRVDDAFRHLLRAVIDNTPDPQRWDRIRWPDDEVVRAAADHDTRRRAWALLAEESPWRQQWTRRNEQDRLIVSATTIVLVLVLIVVATWKFAS